MTTPEPFDEQSCLEARDVASPPHPADRAPAGQGQPAAAAKARMSPAKGLTLNTAAYAPNWKDPRVRNRVQRVIDWCNATLSEATPHSVSKKTLDTVFGQQQNVLSRHLRGKLLVQHGGYRPGEFFYNYTLRPGALEALALELDPAAKPLGEVERLRLQWQEALQAETFEYTDKSDRLWHPLQSLKRDVKQAFWAPTFPYDYDIKACAPTIISHLAKKAGLANVLQEPVKDYLADVKGYRQHVMELTGCDLSTAKRLLNSLFNGAKLARNGYCSAYRALDYNDDAMTALMEDERITALRRAIKRIWRHVERVTNSEPMTPKAKWGMYFKVERQLLEVITEHLRSTNNPHFTEHDGWRCKHSVDTAVLEARLLAATGIKLKIEGGKKA